MENFLGKMGFVLAWLGQACRVGRVDLQGGKKIALTS